MTEKDSPIRSLCNQRRVAFLFPFIRNLAIENRFEEDLFFQGGADWFILLQQAISLLKKTEENLSMNSNHSASIATDSCNYSIAYDMHFTKDNSSKKSYKDNHLEEVYRIAEELLELSWEALHHGHWKDVAIVWRDLYSYSCLLKIFSSILLSTNRSSDETLAQEVIQQAMQTLDLALLMGSPKPQFMNMIHSLLTNLNDRLENIELYECCNRNDSTVKEKSSYDEETKLSMSRTRKRTLPDSPKETNSYEENLSFVGVKENEGIKKNCIDVELDTISSSKSNSDCFLVMRLSSPSMETFYCEYMPPQRPLIITNAMNHWPALYLWQDLLYLKRVAGRRTVPIEVGRHYLDEDWGQQLLTLGEFIDHYVVSNENILKEDDRSNRKSKGYLAQTPLFEQIPDLKQDICTPLYCSLSENDETEEMTLLSEKSDRETATSTDQFPIVNAWFGPKGTISPCHHDPYHNLLCQVVGTKYIRLYAPQYSKNLYPYPSRMLSNSSQIDVEHPDLNKFPLFASVSSWDCILKEGEMLYIPPKWWHYVRSLSISFSVSFWWK